uniref:Ig-like domain-containing protein n=1 Tax=Rhabditophanes sp. KR3021 TaxID=114890 RepID=A0AC35U5Z9_9BILA
MGSIVSGNNFSEEEITSTVQSDYIPLRIEPKGNDFKYVAKAGRKFQVACVFEKEGSAKNEKLVWLNDEGKEIDEDSSTSVFTIELSEKGTNNPKKMLVFTHLEQRDSGKYSCKAKHFDREYSQDIQLIVTDNIVWNQKNDVLGAMKNDPLIIDCGALGEPEPDIEITLDNGDALSPDEYTIAGSEVTIEKLGDKHQDQIFRCLAIQYFEEHETTSIEERKVKVDVWTIPEFENNFVDSYGIIGRKAKIYCNVTQSNPPVTDFHFYKDNTELHDDEKYLLSIHPMLQSATLHIFNVNEDDFDQYKCEATNGKAKSQQTILLKVSNPPSEVKATLHKVHKHSINWELTTSDGKNKQDSIDSTHTLPVTEYIIEYIRKDKILKDGEETSDFNEIDEHSKEWETHGAKIVKSVASNNHYDIHGLRQNTEYAFRFTAVNAAGIGESLVITAKTHHDTHHQLSSGSHILPPLIIQMLAIFGICQALNVFY